jgi:hypothetical protein
MQIAFIKVAGKATIRIRKFFSESFYQLTLLIRISRISLVRKANIFDTDLLIAWSALLLVIIQVIILITESGE